LVHTGGERLQCSNHRAGQSIDLVHYIVHNIVVKKVNIHDAKTHLSRYLAELAAGDTLVLCNRNQPVAELRSLRKEKTRKPRIGVAKGEFTIPDSFFESLPEAILRGFSGKSGSFPE